MKKLFYGDARRAFTIIESVISLVIVSMIVLLIAVVVRSIWQQQQDENESTNFHLYLRAIESSKYHFKYVDNADGRLKLTSHNKTYLVALNSNGIRMTTDKGGYVPLLDHVVRVDWQYERSLLKTRVQMTSGNTFKAVSLIEPGNEH
ncbi:competence type IV pilus minor pilin ComGF [Lactobacillaceae bacterium Melli_B4]